MPKIITNVLKKYIKESKLDDYVFQSNGGGILTQRSIQKVFKNSLKKSEIYKNATCHSLHHSFATHLLEVGTNIIYIYRNYWDIRDWKLLKFILR